ncbi:hypothetical protein [Lederbergia citrea]|uniref:hypothetical protein n=1 Tax=Lederbergia citrea TaxID=2833581 RepID=UPI001BC9058D|nr:hypothetical protein [Lederbergia citrea]MBS4203689.1 hypothetical protein [Lederbergia citrea]
MNGNVKKFKSKGYESINRNMLHDVDSLSLQAIGLLSNLTSMPDSWTIYKTELYKRYAKNGRTSVQNAWNELVKNNYVVQLRRRVGKKFEYVYYHSQEKFTHKDIKDIEKKESCLVWDGKKSSNVEFQHSKKSSASNVDFGLPKMDFPKSTYNKLSNKEIKYKDKDKDLDTIDTVDALQNNYDFPDSLSTEKKEELKEKYMEQAFYDNQLRIPKRLAGMLQVFSGSPEQAKKYYETILLAKHNSEKEMDCVIWLEHEPALEHKIIQAFSRAVRKIEKERNVENRFGYIYTAVFELLTKELRDRKQNYQNENTGVLYNWLDDDDKQKM